MPQWRWWDAVALEDPTDRRGANAVAELEQLALDPLVFPGLYPQAEFSRAIRTTSAASMSSIGGRPDRFG
jgi:hypothetical protein